MFPTESVIQSGIVSRDGGVENEEIVTTLAASTKNHDMHLSANNLYNNVINLSPSNLYKNSI